MITVRARILTPPKPQYKNPDPPRVKFASWNLIGMSFAKPAVPISERPLWAVMTIGPPQTKGQLDRLGDSMNALQVALKSCGLGNHRQNLHVNLPLDPTAKPADNDNKIGAFFQKFKEKQTGLVFVVLPGDGAELYSRIKFFADCKIGTSQGPVLQLISDFVKKGYNSASLTNFCQGSTLFAVQKTIS